MESCCCRVCLNGRLKTIEVNPTDSVEDLLQLVKCDSQSYSVFKISIAFLWAGQLQNAIRDHTPLPLTEPLNRLSKLSHVILILKSHDTNSIVNELYKHETPTIKSHDLVTMTDSCHVIPTNESYDIKESTEEIIETRSTRRLKRRLQLSNEPIVISDDCTGNEDENGNEDCLIIESPQSDDSFSIKEYTITRHDMSTLLPGQWLNDKVINSYMKLLMDCYKVRFLDYVYIIIPVHLNGNHWTILCIDIRNKLIGYYDSLGGKGNRVVMSVKKLMGKYIKCFCEANDLEEIIDKKWRALFIKAPIQSNGNDCGVYMCQYARHVCENLGKRFEPMPPFSSKKIRLKMASELRNKSLS